MCKNEGGWGVGGGCSGKQVFELQSHGTEFKPRRRSSRHEWSLDVHVIKHVCTASTCAHHCTEPQNAVVEFVVGFHERRYETPQQQE